MTQFISNGAVSMWFDGVDESQLVGSFTGVSHSRLAGDTIFHRVVSVRILCIIVSLFECKGAMCVMQSQAARFPATRGRLARRAST